MRKKLSKGKLFRDSLFFSPVPEKLLEKNPFLKWFEAGFSPAFYSFYENGSRPIFTWTEFEIFLKNYVLQNFGKCNNRLRV